MHIYLLIAILSILMVLQEIQKQAIVEVDTKRRVLCFLGSFALTIFFGWRQMPLCLFLFAYFVVQFIRSKKDIWFLLIESLVLSCSALIVFSSLSVLGQDITVLFKSRLIRFIVLIISEAAVMLFCVAWKRFIHSWMDPASDNRQSDSRKNRLFSIFLWFCIAYVYTDSVLILFPYDDIFIPLLLITGNILTLLLVFWFLRHNYFISKNLQWEEEYERLESQKARIAYYQERIDKIARIDGLTGAYTRSYGKTLIEEMYRNRTPLTAVFIDLDGLKNINDEQGHARGDECLKKFSEEFISRLRKDDLFIRLGGDEFLAVLPNAQEEKAREKILRIREEFAQTGSGLMNFSFGTASLDATIEELIKTADRNMYQDKNRLR